MARRGVGSNQYADKSPTATVDEVAGLRALSASATKTPAPSASSWKAYTELASAHEAALRNSLSGPFVKGEAAKHAKMIAAAQDNALRANPDALGAAAIKSARYDAQYSVSGEENPYHRQCEIIRSSLQGEHVDETELAEAIYDLTGIGEDQDLGKSVPLYAALTGNAGDMPIDERASRVDDLRKRMTRARARSLAHR